MGQTELPPFFVSASPDYQEDAAQPVQNSTEDLARIVGHQMYRLQRDGAKKSRGTRALCAVPAVQIDMGADHAGEGMGNKHYRCLRADYLVEWPVAIEER